MTIGSIVLAAAIVVVVFLLGFHVGVVGMRRICSREIVHAVERERCILFLSLLRSGGRVNLPLVRAYLSTMPADTVQSAEKSISPS